MIVQVLVTMATNVKLKRIIVQVSLVKIMVVVETKDGRLSVIVQKLGIVEGHVTRISMNVWRVVMNVVREVCAKIL